ncbi:maleylacetoacetate isomerase [Roseiterribacter gracilis]|uniref:Maleylacetoacetate isomerase n=1 Tax=Roseiterribacter gracilis TaxID=2812848 RepID=A0A8S8XE77_9PROT|nr:maleylacetoacetate isomerase [Rhodospirillales bacterium TMPK1]
MKLYSYWRSSAAYRVRIALNMKRVVYEQVPIHLVKKEQSSPEYLALNPSGLVPALVTDDGQVLTQSIAICEWLEETVSGPSILPEKEYDRVRARTIAQIIACDIHPLNNTRVQAYLRTEMKQDDAQVQAWIHTWIASGLAAAEALIVDGKRYAVGDRPSVADICIVPQLYNARRFDVDLTPYPKLCAIDAEAAKLQPFIDAQPERQPDAPPT